MYMLAQVFPVDTVSASFVLDVKHDVMAWGVVLIGVAVLLMAYRKVRSLIEPTYVYVDDPDTGQGYYEDMGGGQRSPFKHHD